MTDLLDGAELRTFLPTQDFELSKRFYSALGFEQVADGEVAIFNTVGRCGIILQRYYQKDWAENLMLSLLMHDLDAWWARTERADLAGAFGVQPPKAPKMQPWGLRVGFVHDPCGVLWHMIQRPQAAG